jgi:hypothetical protein
MSDKPRNPFTRSQIERAEFGYSGHSVIAPRGMKPDECLDPHVWSLIAEPSRLKVFDEIRVIEVSGAWVQRLIVTFVKGSIVHVARVSVTELKKAEDAASKRAEPKQNGDRYKVEFRGPSARWCVIDTKADTADKQKIDQGIETKEEAEAKLKELLTPA